MTKKIIVNLDNGKSISIAETWNEFARLFALTGNASKARIDAGFKSNNDPHVNSKNAYNLLQREVVQQAYEYHKRRLAEKIDISENRILAEMASIGFSNIANMFNNGNLKAIEEADEATQRSIKSIKIRRCIGKQSKGSDDMEVIAIETHPKLPALNKIAEIKEMTKPEGNQPINVTVNIDGKEATKD